jgi:hypothetical protein
MSNKPQQRIPFSKKTKTWKEESYDYYSNACIPAIDAAKAMRLYRLANGILDETEYTYVTNPLNEENPMWQGYPAKIRNYDIISPNLNTILGDWIDRFFAPIVFAKNANFEQEQFEVWRKDVIKLLQKTFINSVVAGGGPFDQEQISMSLEAIDKKIKNLPNEMAIQGQTAINYIIEDCELIRRFKKLFIDFTIINKCYSYKDVIDDSVFYQDLIPTDVGYLCSPQFDFVEDGEAARIMYTMTINEIYDRLQHLDGFNQEVKDYLDTMDEGYWPREQSYYGTTDVIDAQRKLYDSLFGSYPGNQTTKGISVEYLNWRSFRKKCKVRYKDIFSNTQIDIFDETYKPLPGEDYTWFWDDEIWEGYKIGDKYKVGIRRIPITDEDKARLRINGRNAFTRFGEPQSLMEKSEAYQKKYNIVSYNMELTLNKNLDKLILFPLSLIPEKEGWSEKTTMYYAKALSFLFVNDAKSNFANSVNGLKGIDVSLNQYVVQGYSILEGIKAQLDEVWGLSPQRKGNVAASSLKSTTQIATQRSYVINENLFTEFEEFLTREYQGLLDDSKYAYSEGKHASFVSRSGTIETLNIVNPERYSTTKFGIFAKNGAKEVNKLQALKEQAQAFAQNIPDPSLVARIIDSDNYSELIKYMDQMSDTLTQRAEQARQEQLQTEQGIAQMNAQSKETEIQFKYYKTDADNLRAERVALISSIKSDLDSIAPIIDAPESLQKDQATIDSFQERQKSIADNFFRLKEVQQKEDTLRLKEKELELKNEMNKRDNSTALKNKVVGQK